jgi:hypothetical protein
MKRTFQQKPGLPIIFVHTDHLLKINARQYLDIALRQAARASPESDVILLTDNDRPELPEIRQFALSDHLGAARNFERLYEHISPNCYRYECFCFVRWFYIRHFVKRYDIGRFCMFDTDIMLFSAVEKFTAEFGDHPAGSRSWANVIRAEALDLIYDHFEGAFRNMELFQSAFPHIPDMTVLLSLARTKPRDASAEGIR